MVPKSYHHDGMYGVSAMDWVIVGVTALSVLVGAWRGLVREVVSLAGWVAAFVLAALFGTTVSALLPASWSELTRLVAGHALVFVGVLVLAALVGWIIGRLVRAIGLGGLDRLLGSIFGFLRGALVVALFVIVGSLTALPSTQAWRESVLIPWVMSALHGMRPWLPEGTSRVLQTAAVSDHYGVYSCVESLVL